MSTASDPSVSMARRSRIAGFGTSPYQLNPASSSHSLSATNLGLGYQVSTPEGRSRSVASYESFLQAAQQANNTLHDSSSSSSSVLASSPPLLKQNLCGFAMAHSPDSVATARSIATADSTTSSTVAAAAILPPLPVKSTANDSLKKSHKRLLSSAVSRAQSRSAQRLNDSLVYLQGPAVYCCGECGTHLTARDDIISKSFHGHHGRAYLLETCVNVVVGTPEERRLLTGLHSVCDIQCQRCDTLIGWTYKRAYELGQKYKEGKFIVEKIFLHMEDEDDDDDDMDTSLGGSRRGWSSNRSWGHGGSSRRRRMDGSSSRFAGSEKMIYEYSSG